MVKPKNIPDAASLRCPGGIGRRETQGKLAYHQILLDCYALATGGSLQTLVAFDFRFGLAVNVGNPVAQGLYGYRSRDRSNGH